MLLLCVCVLFVCHVVLFSVRVFESRRHQPLLVVDVVNLLQLHDFMNLHEFHGVALPVPAPRGELDPAERSDPKGAVHLELVQVYLRASSIGEVQA